MATGGATIDSAPETLPQPYTQIFMPPSNLPLPKALVLDDNVAEQTEHQVKLMGASANVNVLKQGRSKSNRSSMPLSAANNKKQSSRGTCGRCGTSHAKKNVRHLARSATDVVT